MTVNEATGRLLFSQKDILQDFDKLVEREESWKFKEKKRRHFGINVIKLVELTKNFKNTNPKESEITVTSIYLTKRDGNQPAIYSK